MAQQHSDAELLRAAVIGYEQQIAVLRARIAEIQKKIGERANALQDGNPTRHRLSSAARKRIGLAQKKRWAAFHAATGTAKKTARVPAKKVAKNRKLSAEGRAKIVAALKKRWAAKKVAATGTP